MASQPSHSGIIVGVGTPMVTWVATPIPAGFQDWQEQPA
jgi:hypothetical protein